MRREPLAKHPGIAEAVEWAEAATLLNEQGARWPEAFRRSLGVVLKDEDDLVHIAPKIDAILVEAAGMMDTSGPIAHFLGFTALLRRAGFAVAPEQTMAWLAAIELLGPREIGDIRRAAHATLAPQPERFAEFDALFDAHFLGAVEHGAWRASRAKRSRCAPPTNSSVGPEPIFGEDTRESGAKATGAERLSARRLTPGEEAETLAPLRPRAPRPRAAAARLSLARGARRTPH